MAVLVGVSGCSGLFGLGEPGERPDGDAPAGEPADARLCWGSDIEICLTKAPTEPVVLSGALATGFDQRCRPESAPFCVIAGTMVSIPAGATLEARGPRPLVLIATQQLVVDGVLDAASHAATLAVGPGAQMAACNPFVAQPSAHGGGAGGSFVGLGGAGAGNEAPGTDTGGAPGAAIATLAFRGGCAGQNGGTVTGTFGLGGAGGGALYLIAGEQLAIANRVTASGAAGHGGQCTPAPCGNTSGDDANGGGGGGSGGMIVLDAPAVAVMPPGAVLADGGGGGEGASHSENGGDGGESSDGILAASGGSSTAKHGGDGGFGAHAVALTGGTGGLGTSSSPGGGGGGGGGAGMIRLHQAMAITGGGVVSPPVR